MNNKLTSNYPNKESSISSPTIPKMSSALKEGSHTDESEEENEETIKIKENKEELSGDKIRAKIIEFDKLSQLQLSSRRGSKGNLLGKVGLSHSGPSRSLSFNTTRDKIRLPEQGSSVLQRSPVLPASPLAYQPNNSINNGSNINRRSFGAPDSKLVILGVTCVGKSAVVVRLLTGRFIWEYDPTLEAIYRYHTTVDDEATTSELLDTAGLVDGRVNEAHVKWGDGFLIVYSLTDRNSFLAVPEIHASIASLKHTPNFPCVLLGNKSDLVHLAKVCEEESSMQAAELGVSYFGASACEGSPSLWEAFSELHRDVVRRFRSRRRRSSAKVVIEGFYKMFAR